MVQCTLYNVHCTYVQVLRFNLTYVSKVFSSVIVMEVDERTNTLVNKNLFRKPNQNVRTQTKTM
jgi:hypothetical protein